MTAINNRLLRARWFFGGMLAAAAVFAQLGAAGRDGENRAAAGRDEQQAHPARKIEPVPEDGKLRIICFGAHPDDCELKAAGVAA